MESSSRWAPPVLLGVVVFAFGFGALLALALWSSYPHDLPGLGAYRSATYGDGLALPLLSALLLVAVRSRELPPLRAVQWGRFWTGVAATAGLCAGGVTQVLWWLDPHPHLNWTLPAPHRFTFAGVWHAGFLIAAAGLLLGLWAALLVKLHATSMAPSQQSERLLGSPASVWIAACVLFFIAMLILDNWGATGTQAGLTTAVAMVIVGVVMLVSLAIACGRAALAAVPAAGLGVVVASAGAVVAVQLPRSQTQLSAGLVSLLFVTLTAVGIVFAVTRSAIPSWRERYLVGALLILLGTAWLDHRDKTPLITVGVAAAAVLAAWVVRLARDRRAATSRDFLAACGTSAVLLGVARVAVWLQQQGDQGYLTAGFVLTVCGVVFGRFLFPHVRDVYQALIRSEEQLADDAPERLSREQQLAIATTAWKRAAGYAVAAISALLMLSIAVGPSLGFQSDGERPPRLTLFLCVWGIALALALPPAWLAFGLERRIEAIAQGGSRRGPQALLAVCVVGCAVWIVAAGLLIRGIGGGWQAIPLLQASLVGVWTFLSLVDSQAVLQRVSLGGKLMSAAGFCSLSVAVAVFALATGGVRAGRSAIGVNPSLGVLGAVLAVNFILTIGMASVIVLVNRDVASKLARRPRHLKTYDLPAMVMQDQGLMLTLVVFAVWLPALALAHVPKGATERWVAIASLLAGFYLLLGRTFFWVLDNNIGHVERQARRHRLARPTSKDPQGILRRLRPSTGALLRQMRKPDRTGRPEADHLEALEGHIVLQNALALGLILLTVVGLLVYINDAPSAEA